MRMDSLREYADRGTLLDLGQHADAVGPDRAQRERQHAGRGGRQDLRRAGRAQRHRVRGQQDPHRQVRRDDPGRQHVELGRPGDVRPQITAKASGGRCTAPAFEPATLANIIVFTRQRGEDFYTADGKLGRQRGHRDRVVRDDRAGCGSAGGFPPAGFFEETWAPRPTQSYLAKGTHRLADHPDQQLPVVQRGGRRQPGAAAHPRRDAGHAARAVGRLPAPVVDRGRVQAPDEALKLLNFLVNDVEASKATGTTRGVPPSQKVADEIKPTLEPGRPDRHRVPRRPAGGGPAALVHLSAGRQQDRRRAWRRSPRRWSSSGRPPQQAAQGVHRREAQKALGK